MKTVLRKAMAGMFIVLGIAIAAGAVATADTALTTTNDAAGCRALRC
jgi:hypothetical protein